MLGIPNSQQVRSGQSIVVAQSASTCLPASNCRSSDIVLRAPPGSLAQHLRFARTYIPGAG
jgi:hypothetical protein